MNSVLTHLKDIGGHCKEWIGEKDFDIIFKKSFPLLENRANVAGYERMKTALREIRYFLSESMQVPHVRVIHKSLSPYKKTIIDSFLSRWNEFIIPRTPIDDLFPKVTGFKDHRKILWEWRAQNILRSKANRDILIAYIDRVIQILLKRNEKPILFNKETGEVIYKWELLDTLTPNQVSYKFFEILYDNYGNFVSNEKIVGHVFWTNSDWRALRPKVGFGKYCAKIKNDLIDSLKEIIDSPKGNCRLLVKTDYKG